MTTTQTPRPSPRQSAVRSGAAQKVRIAVTGIAVIMIIAGAFYLAFNIGNHRQIIAAAGMLAAGLGLAVISQRPGFYTWIDDLADKPAEAQAPRVPKQRTRRAKKSVQYQIPTVKPAEELGAEFRYIILFGRHLAERAPHVFEAMAEFWDQIDWESDAADDEYREAVDLLWDLARDHDGWNENVTQEQLLAGKFNPANPFAFLAEAESYHPMVAATAALMLVRDDQQVTRENFDIVMQPWTDLHLPYRLADVIFTWVPAAKEYQSKDAPPRARSAARPSEPPTAPPQFRLDVDMDTALNTELARISELPAAPPVPPVPPPPVEPAPAAEAVADVVMPKHIEPDADDVDTPGTDLVLMAAEMVISTQFGSTPMVARKLRVGFTMALKIMHLLQGYGVVDRPSADNGPREVMIPVSELEEALDFIREQEAERINRSR